MYLFEGLHHIIQGYLPPEQIELVKRAFVIARDAHEGQARSSGEPYITHPVAVASIIAEMRLDHEAVMAALLHDVIEDTPYTEEQLKDEFGASVAEIVEGVSKLDKLKFRTRQEAEVANFRKMILAMTKDIRVVLIKLADRTHNMRTLGALRPDKRRRIAKETLEIYAPLAHRLGIEHIKNELEDPGFEAMHPQRYAVLQKVVEWQKKLMNEKQIIGLTFEIIKNIEFMLGSEKDKKYVELINQGNEFLEKRDYENARKLFTEAINYNEKGYLELAKSYYAEGKGEKTKEVFERAYEMGVKEAAYKLGQYMDVVEGNEKEAEKWYKIGKEIGDARAIYQLAMLYETSREFGKSEEEAYGIFEISANMKYAPAIMDMAFYSDRAENKNKVKEWTSKLLNETGLIELGKNMIGDAQNLLEEMGEKIEDKISGKDYEIEYDEDLIYFIKKFKSWN